MYQDKNDEDPLNPKTNMNIVLKKDKQDGVFGKFGIGGGTRKHYAADGMITYFSPKNNFSLVGAANDVNKRAGDVSTLMGFNSFKGEGINSDYHSDFRQQGYNIFRGGGFTGSHDFSKEGDTRQAYYKTNMLKGEMFSSTNINNTTSNGTSEETLPTTPLDQTKYKVNRTSTGDRKSDNFNIRANASYDKRFQYGSINGTIYANSNRGTSSNTSISNAFNERSGIGSVDSKQSKSDNSSNNLSGNFRGTIQRQYDFAKRKNKWFSMDLSYNFNLGNEDNNSREITDFKATDAAQNLYIDRLYNSRNKSSNHTLTTTFSGITQYFARRFRLFQVGIGNTIAVYDNNENRQVSNWDTVTKMYVINQSLTNVSHYKTVDEKPSISFSKSFSKSLDNRYSKYLSINATARGQMYSQRNSALQSIQNLDRTYHYFIPTASISYSNYQYGDFSKNYDLSYSTNVQFPTVDQIAPIYDNSNIYDVPIGNPNLRPSYNHQLSFTYSFYDQKTKNAMNSYLSLSAGITKDNIIDSSVYDNSIGRRIRTSINGSGRRYLNYSGYINKAYRFKDHQVQLNGNSSFSYSRYGTVVNGTVYDVNNASGNLSGAATYTYKSIWTASAEERVDGGKITQVGFSQNTYYTWSTRAGVAFAFPRSIFFNSRVEFNNTKSSGVKDNVYYTILNADIGYRFLKGAEAEIKISALDILRQNQSFRNYINANTVQSTRTNVLSQYFMLTLAYYPRKFGMKK
ncbi:outer membrane beta-barrel protein [Mucilaginibacter antarcticus]|uniref:outer membrane beta-barrel protein n=1 Tax=Mucilaginibacter antarcticus TaxID=1855725 RepID=UPI003633FDC4